MISIFYIKEKFLNGIIWNSTGKEFHVSHIFKGNSIVLKSLKTRGSIIRENFLMQLRGIVGRYGVLRSKETEIR